MKKLGIGSISMVFVISAFVWSYNIGGYCLGDQVLNWIHFPIWSNGISGIHYTVFYAFIFLIPAIIVGGKKNSHLFATTGKRLAIIFSVFLCISFLFII